MHLFYMQLVVSLFFYMIQATIITYSVCSLYKSRNYLNTLKNALLLSITLFGINNTLFCVILHNIYSFLVNYEASKRKCMELYKLHESSIDCLTDDFYQFEFVQNGICEYNRILNNTKKYIDLDSAYKYATNFEYNDKIINFVNTVDRKLIEIIESFEFLKNINNIIKKTCENGDNMLLNNSSDAKFEQLINENAQATIALNNHSFDASIIPTHEKMNEINNLFASFLSSNANIQSNTNMKPNRLRRRKERKMKK